jgi:pantothenate kinase-related protein Tda10
MSSDQRADRLAAIVALVDASEQRCGTTRLVAIDGPSGSGKTTLARDLTAELAAPTVHMDDIYPGWKGLREATALVARWIVEPLQSGRPARYRRWDWERSQYAEWVQVPAAEVVVLEGCGSGARPGGDAVSALVWVEADEAVRYARGISRDEGFAAFWDLWAAQERELFESDGTRHRADLVLDTTHDRL